MAVQQNGNTGQSGVRILRWGWDGDEPPDSGPWVEEGPARHGTTMASLS